MLAKAIKQEAEKLIRDYGCAHRVIATTCSN